MSHEELERIDREWDKERERYMVRAKSGGRYVPSAVAAVVVGVLAVGIGLFWTVAGFGMARDYGGAAVIFPLCGLIFLICGIANSLYQFKKAKRYQTAYRAYQRRRSASQEGLKE